MPLDIPSDVKVHNAFDGHIEQAVKVIGFSSGGSRAGHQADTTSPTKRSKMPAENAAIPTTRPRCWSAITRRPGTWSPLQVTTDPGGRREGVALAAKAPFGHAHSTFGLPTRERRSSKLGWQLVVDRQQLPTKTYAAAAMSMNRSLKRLMERGLVVSSNALYLEGKSL